MTDNSLWEEKKVRTWQIGEFTLQECERYTHGECILHYHVQSSEWLDDRIIAEWLKAYINKVASKQRWKGYNYPCSYLCMDWKDSKGRTQVSIYTSKNYNSRWGEYYHLHIQLFNRDFKLEDLIRVLYEISLERDEDRNQKLSGKLSNDVKKILFSKCPYCNGLGYI